MSFRIDVREVVEIYLRLKKEGVDPFSIESESEMARAGALMAPDPGTSTVPLFDALRAIDMYVKENLASLSPVSVVATQPGRGRVPSTREIVRSLLLGTKKELLVVGYAVTDRKFVELLHTTARRGIAVTLVGDRVKDSLQETLAKWPAELARPVALEGVEPIPDGRFSVHGKVMVSDGHRALFGSADFSAAGFRDNFELGVLVEGHAARELRDTVEELRRQGWLMPVPEQPVTQSPELV